MKRLHILYILLLCSLSICAQSIHISAPRQVAVGENFKVAYTIDTQDVSDFRMGNVPSGIPVVAGPYRSSQSSIQMINGHTSSSSSVTFTYTLYAEDEGTFNIAPAVAKIGGKSIQSAAVKIVVSGTVSSTGSAPRMHENHSQQDKVATGNELFIRVSANKDRVHEQEPVVLTYKVYTTLELTQLEGKMPDLKGFHTQEITLPQQKTFHVEKVNGRNYRCVTWSQYVMFPQMTGQLTVPSITFKGIAVKENRNVDPFEAFFNGGSAYTEIKKDVVAPSITIKVDPLPTRPDNFSGGVGVFGIDAKVEKSVISAGSPVNLKVTISGVGNLKLMKEPVVKFPTSFDTYDAKVSDKTQLTSNGVEGSVSYDYVAIPTSQGEFTIPPIELCYYDVNTDTYKTVKTDSLRITVSEGNNGNSTLKDYEKKSDIRDIITSEGRKLTKSHFFASTSYFVVIALLTVVFAGLFLALRKRLKANSDIIVQRNKRAAKTASKRLRKVRQLMREDKSSDFYDEMLRTLWGYAAFKLNIPVEKLSRENLMSQFSSHSVPNEISNQFLSSLDVCEQMKYAPGEPAASMKLTYDTAEKSIIEIENAMKEVKKRNRKSILSLIMVSILLLSCITVSAQSDSTANVSYQTGRYQKAAEQYERLIKQTPTDNLYFNLGNAYYRQNNMPLAILSYERALHINTNHSDALFNLHLAQKKSGVSASTISDTLVMSWLKSFVFIFSTDGWAFIAVFSLCALFLSVLCFFFLRSAFAGHISLYSAIIFFTLFMLSNVCALSESVFLDTHDNAIVVKSNIHTYTNPSTEADSKEALQPGAKVKILSGAIKGWSEIKTVTGDTGWVPSDALELI